METPAIDPAITAIDDKYKWLLGFWISVIISWILLALTMQAIENSSLRKEREYLRNRLFVEMNLRTEVQKTVETQIQTHALYEAEIALLRKQAEMARVDTYIARINTMLTPTTRWKIIQAVYSCSEMVKMDPLLPLAVMEQESRFKVDARSEKDARGLMQLLPSTAATMGISLEQIYNVDLNVCGGIIYLAKHLRTYNGVQKAALRRYYGGGEEWEYSAPVLKRYTRIQNLVRL